MDPRAATTRAVVARGGHPDAAVYRAYDTEDVVTGEGVAVELPVATLPLRMASGAIDLALLIGLLILGTLGVGLLVGDSSEAVQRTAMLLTVITCMVIVPTAVETLTRGKSLGRLLLGLRVVRDDGGPVGVRQALIRALIGVVEVLMLTGVPAFVASLTSARSKRLGDMAAGTYAISERARLRLTPPPAMPGPLAAWAAAADIASLPPGQAVSIRAFLQRAPGLGPQARDALGEQLLRSVLQHVSPPPPPGIHREVVLAAVLAERRQRDLRRLARDAQLRARLLR